MNDCSNFGLPVSKAMGTGRLKVALNSPSKFHMAELYFFRHRLKTTVCRSIVSGSSALVLTGLGESMPVTRCNMNHGLFIRSRIRVEGSPNSRWRGPVIEITTNFDIIRCELANLKDVSEPDTPRNAMTTQRTSPGLHPCPRSQLPWSLVDSNLGQGRPPWQGAQ